MAERGLLIPNDPVIELANFLGEPLFNKTGCPTCRATLPLTAGNNPGLPSQSGWMYFEPNPYNPNSAPFSSNLKLGPTNYPVSAPALAIDLTNQSVAQPRQPVINGVATYTALKVHDISATSNPTTDPECEPLDQNQPVGSPGFFAGNKFCTRKLWGFYNQGGAFIHHGKLPTAREAVETHNGEALALRQSFDALLPAEQDATIEFLSRCRVFRQIRTHLSWTNTAILKLGHQSSFPGSEN